MKPNDLALLRRKELVGAVAWIAWVLTLLVGKIFGSIGFFVAWIATAAWVALDEKIRRGHISMWTIFTVITGPLGFALYYLTRTPSPIICSQCGSVMGSYIVCPACGHTTKLAQILSAIGEVYSSLANSLVHSPAQKAKETAKQLSFALAAVVIISSVLYVFGGFMKSFVGMIFALSMAAYWVLVAWWVYLDSAWRKMDGMPWAVLTLITNLVGLVTYLVIRYPDPRTCVNCGSSVPVGQKYCPFCGSEAETMCPQCQAAVNPDWQFCPTCAARLTPPKTTEKTFEQPAADSTLTIHGSVLDAAECTPIAGAIVKIDSLSEDISVTTDSLGKFQFSGLQQRPYVLIASAEGYVIQAKSYMPGAKHISFTLCKFKTVPDSY